MKLNFQLLKSFDFFLNIAVLIETGLIWISDICNGKKPDYYNGVNLVHLGMESSRASPKLEDSPSPWGHLAPLATQLRLSPVEADI